MLAAFARPTPECGCSRDRLWGGGHSRDRPSGDTVRLVSDPMQLGLHPTELWIWIRGELGALPVSCRNCPGALWECSGSRLEVPSTVSGRPLGPSWALLGPFWGRLGPPGARLGSSFGLEAIQKHIGAFLGTHRGYLGSCVQQVWGASKLVPNGSRNRSVEALLGPSSGSLSPLRLSLRPHGPSLEFLGPSETSPRPSLVHLGTL